MDKIDISIIVPVFNAAALIRRCIESVLSQEGNFSREIIFVDDGSTDNSVEIIKSYNREELRVICQDNSGPAKARNRGLEEARGEYLTFIDADDYWAPSFLNTTLTYLRNHEEIIAVSVGQRHIREGRDSVVPRCIKEYDSPVVLNDFYAFWNQYHHVCTGSVVMKTIVAKTIGGQREDLKVAEDWEFWLLFATYGKWAFIPEVLFTSDGDIVTKKRGWIEKMQPRWNSAPSMEVWQKRLAARESFTEEMKKSIGYVACRMIRSYILSGRIDLAREEVIKHKNYFPERDKYGRIYCICCKSKVLWRFMSKLLLWREYHK